MKLTLADAVTTARPQGEPRATNAREIQAMRQLLLIAMMATSIADPAHGQAVAKHRSVDVAFIGASVITMIEGDSIRRDQTVIVRDGVIRSISARSLAKVPAGAKRIDARGKYLIPGLTDSHVHLEYFSDPGVLALFLANGITSIRSMDGRPFILEWRKRVEAGEVAGPSIYTAGPIIDGAPPVRDDNLSVKDSVEARAAVRAQNSAGYDFIKIYSGLSPEAYRGVMAEAKALGLRVSGHVPRRVPIRTAVSSGQDAIEHLTDLDELVEAARSPFAGRFHWSKLYLAMPMDSAKVLEASSLIAKAKTWIVPTMIQADRALLDSAARLAARELPGMSYIPNEGRDLWESESRRSSARLDTADWSLVERGKSNRRQILLALHSAGVNLAPGTDTPNAFVVPGCALHDELQSYVDAGIPRADVLRASTHDAARLMEKDSTHGTVETGKVADLVLLSGNPLDDLRHLRMPEGVMIRGRWLSSAELRSMLRPVVLR